MDEELISRNEVVALLFGVNDIAALLSLIEQHVRRDDEEDDHQG